VRAASSSARSFHSRAKPWELWGLPLMGLLGIAATLFLFSTAVVRQAWGGFRKVSIRRWLGSGRRGAR
jgi:hypothetical protein